MTSAPTFLAFIFTVLASIIVVAVIIILGWFLIWKAFLSKFRLVRELLGQVDGDEISTVDHTSGDRTTHNKTRKVRRD